MDPSPLPCNRCTNIYRSIEHNHLDCFFRQLKQDDSHYIHYVYLYQAIGYHAIPIYDYLRSQLTPEHRDKQKIGYSILESVKTMLGRQHFSTQPLPKDYSFYCQILTDPLVLNIVEQAIQQNAPPHHRQILYPDDPSFFRLVSKTLTCENLILYHQYSPFPKEYRWCLLYHSIETCQPDDFTRLYRELQMDNIDNKPHDYDLPPLLFFMESTRDFLVHHLPFDRIVDYMHLHYDAGLLSFYDLFRIVRAHCKGMAPFEDDLFFLTLRLFPEKRSRHNPTPLIEN